MRRFAMIAVCVLAVSACAGGTSQNTAASPGGDIKIGLLTSLTGNYAPLGTNDKLAAEQVVNQLNAKGGINGRKIALIEMDDASDANQTVIDYQKLVDQGVVAIEGPPQSTAELALIPKVDIAKVPDVSVGASDDQVIPVHPYVFQTTPLASQVAGSVLKFFQNESITRIAMLTDTKNAYATKGHDATMAAISKYGVSVVDDETFETSQSQFGPQLTKIKNTNAQFLLVWATGAPPVTITKQWKANALPQKLMMTAAEASPLYVNPAEPEVEGVYVQATMGVLGKDVPTSNKYKKLIDEFAGPWQQANSSWPPQFAWDSALAMLFIIDAIKRKGATPDGIQKGLESINLDTPQGHYVFTKDKHYGMPDSSNLVAIVQNKDFVPGDASERTKLATAGGQ